MTQKSLVVLLKLKTASKKYFGPNLLIFVNLAPQDQEEQKIEMLNLQGSDSEEI